MTEDQIRAAVRAEIQPLRDEMNGRFDTASAERASLRASLNEASAERELMWGVLIENTRQPHQTLKQAKEAAAKPQRKRRKPQRESVAGSSRMAAKEP